MPPEVTDVEMTVTVRISIKDREPIERITGPGGPEWRAQMFDLRTKQDVLQHWARNAIHNGVEDVSELDGWADVPIGSVTFEITGVDGT